VSITDSDLVDVSITASELENVVINDVDVAPLVRAELDRREGSAPHDTDAGHDPSDDARPRLG